MAHDEFPELTHQAKCVLMNNMNGWQGIDVSMPYWDRRFAAALLREAVKQAAPLSIGPGSIQVVRVADLLDIADNLHVLPPPPRLVTLFPYTTLFRSSGYGLTPKCVLNNGMA